MLDAIRGDDLKALLKVLPCRVVVPPGWKKSFARPGNMPAAYHDDTRRFARVPCSVPAVLEVESTLPAFPRPPELYAILMKDLSRQGVALLHSEQLFPGERFQLLLPNGCLAYTVCRCLRHNERCFEIGAELVASA
jgi:PilZ domain